MAKKKLNDFQEEINEIKEIKEDIVETKTEYQYTSDFSVIKDGEIYKVIRHGQLIGNYDTEGKATNVAKDFNLSIRK
jgi:hypothetical protein